MAKKLFLLDGMALVYRAHFALAARPILNSQGVNTSALYGFTQTLLDIIRTQSPTHIAVAFDTAVPTQRHVEFPDYKANRQEMPEDLSAALPHVRRMIEAFNIQVLTCDGYEADDIIGTLVKLAEKQDFQSYMVTPDKDFGQLVSASTFLYKPGRMGDTSEIMGLPEICARWGIDDPIQVIDIIALMGDASDNIPGVPGIGEKTAIKLIKQFGSVENLLEHAAELTGKLRDNILTGRDVALLSKRLATINVNSPCVVELEGLALQPYDEPVLKELFTEFEFNSIGKRLFGQDFKAGRGGIAGGGTGPASSAQPAGQGEMVFESEPAPSAADAAPIPSPRVLRTIKETPLKLQVVETSAQRTELIAQLGSAPTAAIELVASGPDAKSAKLRGFVFAVESTGGWFVKLPAAKSDALRILNEFASIWERRDMVMTGHDLKYTLSAFLWHGLSLQTRLFDTMIAHSLIEPDQRHTFEYLAEVYLGYTPMPRVEETQPSLSLGLETEAGVPLDQQAMAALERAALNLQLQKLLVPLLREKAQEKVFYEIEAPLVPVLAAMEHAGIRVDASALHDFAEQLGQEIERLGNEICRLAGTSFNLNSPRQLGQILFEALKICAAPKKTKSGQYATDEQTLAALAPDHEIVRLLLDHRAASKLKTTYADALPSTIWPATQRIHTTYNQVATTTGRLNSQNPNLQNIPIRTDRGQEIRKAFVPAAPEYVLLSADYSQIELRIIAALSKEKGLIEAFETGADVHTATAARVYGVFPDLVTPEMRRKAKMVNYGIAYGISAFGLAQRLAIPRREASEIIQEYFRQFPGIRTFMDSTIAFCRQHGYVETVTGRRRYLRDIVSSNATVRSAAERNAINAPIQGTAADMIKVAMIRIFDDLQRRQLRTRMLLQVHDELVFDLHREEEAAVRSLVEERMRNAIPLGVPIEVEMGVGETWLSAH
jgi:DNA polymerase-1